MAKWTLTRQSFGCEEFTLSSGDKVTVGRGINNTITLSSAVISRNHCVIDVQNNKALITDLQSSNGVYVGTVRIPPNTPYVVEDSDIIGLGWTIGAPLVNIQDSEKYVFKLNKDVSTSNLTSRIRFQSDSEIDDIEAEIAKFDEKSKPCEIKNEVVSLKSPVLGTKLSLKRKIVDNVAPEIKGAQSKSNNDDSVINISDSDSDSHATIPDIDVKKIKLKSIKEEPQKQLPKVTEIKIENELTDYDAFNVKQEYLGYDDECINVSDNESDSESEHWLLRLSQNSPGKPFTKISKPIKQEIKPEDGSYSQIDDDFISNHLIFEDDEEIVDNLISIPEPEEKSHEVPDISKLPDKVPEYNENVYEEEEFSDDIISIDKPPVSVSSRAEKEISRDEPDGFSTNNLTKQTENLIRSPEPKKAQMIEPLAKLPKGKSHHLTESKTKSSPKHSSRKVEKKYTKKYAPTANKEERKKKLKELALKDKDSETKTNKDSNEINKHSTKVKVTSSNRGAFLSEVVQAVVKPVKRKENINKSKDKISDLSPKQKEAINKETTENIENIKKSSEKSSKDKTKRSKHKDIVSTESKSYNTSTKIMDHPEVRVPLKNLRSLTDTEDSYSGKPVSKVGPMPAEKPKKSVRFSDEPPKIREFEIEPGNKMKKTSLVKTTLVVIRQTPVFSLEKITLMKILRWNPHWLEEQLNNNDPPPILGHNNVPMTLFHSFVNHSQYVQLVGDLLLMEIWECLTIAYMKTRNQSNELPMRIESLPPIPTHERCFELFSLSVNVSLPPSETKNLPRVGEIMLVTFGSENSRHQRFFFVHNIRYLPSAPGQSSKYYSISLHATVTEKMMSMRPGELIYGKSLAYINKELMLFEAMEYLAGSPLSDAILKPESHHFISSLNNQTINLQSQWTTTLNPRQLKAVSSSVTAALSDKPSIQMVQGPPGTGKSSVICAIVMTYFYNAQGKKEQNRSKILICATSNAAVDGLVIRLLNLRQSLPKQERFRMVRVGREEAMHPVAANISSQQLAHRELTRINDQPPATAGLNEEISHLEAKLKMWKTARQDGKDPISHLEAKINMWKTARQDAKDPVRIAYCQGRISDLVKRITLLRSGGGGGAGGEVRPEQLAAAERRIVEGADIIVTTLASAHNYKMKGLKRRIALCIIDEAGQVIEPETLIPLTLDVTKLTLIGDPQQLPGFICSQRAKKHGLSESLFSRLTSYTDDWGKGSPVILLNQQYRMHPDIADYPSRAFYGGMVQTISPPRPDMPIPPYIIVGIASGDKGQGVSGANELEAWGVTRLVMALGGLARPLKLNLAVITPYNAHKELIKKHLKTLHTQGDCQLEVNTVDSFQGQERDVVVVSLARSQGVGFLTDMGRMNVMLTRAKHALIICLNPTALLKNSQWRTLIEDSQRRDFYRRLPNQMCQPITAAQLPNDDILKYIIEKKSDGSYR